MRHEEQAKALLPGLYDCIDNNGEFYKEGEAIAILTAALREVERETWAGLKVTNDQLRWALKELGPTGTNAEAYIKAAVEYLIDVRAKVQP